MREGVKFLCAVHSRTLLSETKTGFMKAVPEHVDKKRKTLSISGSRSLFSATYSCFLCDE